MPAQIPTQSFTHQAKKVLGFLVAKGLLRSPNFRPAGAVKLTVEDFLKTAEEYEPRVLAVLPAALIHFPKTFLDRHRLPRPLEDILEAIENGEKAGPDLFGVPYLELRRWAFAKLKDGRAKPLAERKIQRTYRFSPKTIKVLELKARSMGVTETSLIEDLISRHKDG